MSRTVSGRIAFLAAGLCALGLAGFAGSLYLWVREVGRQEKDAAVRSRLQIFSEQFIEEYEEHVQGIHPHLSEVLDAVVAIGGCVARASRRGGAAVYASPGYEAKAPGYSFASTRVKASSGDEFDLTVGLNPAPFEAPLAQLRVYMGISLPLLVLLISALAQVGARRVLAPLEDIRRQAERISRQNVSERIPLDLLYGEIRQFARTFNEMLDRLDGGIQDLQSFAADAAHELRTPLATLRAEVETAIQAPRSAEEHERILLSVSEEVSRMTGVVTDLLTLARLDMKQFALKKERVALRPILEETRETWQPLADTRRITISVDGPPAEVRGDPGALRRVFMNLVHNAVKYSSEGGRVEVGVRAAEGRVEVRVQDRGMGIEAEHLPRLFRRFYRVDQARSRDSGGAGLGLAICKSFVEAHEGRIEVASAPGEGSRFTVTFPAFAPREAELRPPGASPGAAAPDPSAHR